MEDIKTPKKLKLHKALKIAYMRNKPKRQARLLKKYGYRLDTDLSNPRETMVAYNPFDKKVLFVANGTSINSEKDILTDIVLAHGGIKQTPRFEDTKNILNKAKEKYKGSNFVLAGHSLGSSLVNYAGSGSDKIVTYNGAFTPNQKARPNVTNYRTEGDVVSYYAPKANTTTLLKPKPESDAAQSNPESVIYSSLKGTAMRTGSAYLQTFGVPAVASNIASVGIITGAEQLAKKTDILKPHQLDNIKDAPIFL